MKCDNLSYIDIVGKRTYFFHSEVNGKVKHESTPSRKERPQKRGGGGRFEPYGNANKRYRVFVSNIPYDVKWQALKDLMKEKGKVARLEVDSLSNYGPGTRLIGHFDWPLWPAFGKLFRDSSCTTWLEFLHSNKLDKRNWRGLFNGEACVWSSNLIFSEVFCAIVFFILSAVSMELRKISYSTMRFSKLEGLTWSWSCTHVCVCYAANVTVQWRGILNGEMSWNFPQKCRKEYMCPQWHTYMLREEILISLVQSASISETGTSMSCSPSYSWRYVKWRLLQRFGLVTSYIFSMDYLWSFYSL